MVLKENEKNKIVFHSNVIWKIDFMHKERPGKEWSGIIFYKCSFDEEGAITVNVVDFALMDYDGSATLTKFDNKDAYVGEYTDDHRELMGCYTGLLHSHHIMNCGPSPTDDNTMKQEATANDRNNFLSVIVYTHRDAQPYSCRMSQHNVEITKRKTSTKTIVTVDSVKESYVLSFGNKYGETKVTLPPVVTESEKVEENETKVDFKIFDIVNIEYQEPSLDEFDKKEFLERVEFLKKTQCRDEIKKTISITNSNYNPKYRDYDDIMDGWYDDEGWGDYYGLYTNSNTTSNKRYISKEEEALMDDPKYDLYSTAMDKILRLNDAKCEYSNPIYLALCILRLNLMNYEYSVFYNSLTYSAKSFDERCEKHFKNIDIFKKFISKVVNSLLGVVMNTFEGKKKNKVFLYSLKVAYLIIWCFSFEQGNTSRETSKPYLYNLLLAMKQFFNNNKIKD